MGGEGGVLGAVVGEVSGVGCGDGGVPVGRVMVVRVAVLVVSLVVARVVVVAA